MTEKQAEKTEQATLHVKKSVVDAFKAMGRNYKARMCTVLGAHAVALKK